MSTNPILAQRNASLLLAERNAPRLTIARWVRRECVLVLPSLSVAWQL
ncbi:MULTISPECIES: hypothetical protein [Rhodococcus]|nr:hypothetical protein [Rhodococcus sp. JS3073]WAM15286.1 hypothetical protein OYT95_01000 [Rhodococcus sp. JS3073]